MRLLRVLLYFVFLVRLTLKAYSLDSINDQPLSIDQDKSNSYHGNRKVLVLQDLLILKDAPTNIPSIETIAQTKIPKMIENEPPVQQIKLIDLIPQKPNVIAPTIQSQPSVALSVSPTSFPTYSPSAQRSENPTTTPSISPSDIPSFSPTITPTTKAPAFPTALSVSPTSFPTYSPSAQPSENPTTTPSISPSDIPSFSPTITPTTKAPAFPTALSVSPTSFPTYSPSAQPSENPTTTPSISPSDIPSFSPTITPTTKAPAFPTNYPTFAANYEYPDNWFNYDISATTLYGPKEWFELDISSSSSNWNKYTPGSDTDNIYLSYIDDNTNECSRNGVQSPINVVPNRSCKDDHTPGRNRGKNKFADLNFMILPSTLRVTLGDPDTAGKSDWSNLSPAIPAVFVNVKIPSEHYINGMQYSGEFQIYHYFDKGRGRFVVTSILMDYSDDKENIQLEQFIREWEEVAWKTKNTCDIINNPTVPPYTRTYPILDETEMTDIWGDPDTNSKSDYDIHRFMTTGWFCGYEGSITEPPCSRRAYWRVLDLPMKISKYQYDRIKKLIVGRLNKKCQPESAHYNGRVNRPIQYRDDVWCCTSSDWSFRTDRDPSYWFDSWPADYHGWRSIEQLKNTTSP